MATSISDAQFDQEVVKADVPVVVDFWAPWCGPCKIMGPVVDQLSQEYDGKVKFVKINVDEHGTVAGSFNVMSIPTFLLFKDGKPVKGFVGAASKEDFKRVVDELIA
jgi:thioredoxin 1